MKKFFKILLIVWVMQGLPVPLYAKSLFELSDAVSALKVVAGYNTAYLNADLDRNGKTGLEDVICLLQFIADLRCKETYLANFSCDPPPPQSGGYTGPITIQFQADASPFPEGPVTDYKWYADGEFISSDRLTEKTFEGEKDWWWVSPIVTIRLKVITWDMCEYESTKYLDIRAGATPE